MSAKSTLASLSTAVILTLSVGVYSFAQDTGQFAIEPAEGEPTAYSSVAAGTYREMTWLRKIKLATAPFFNPALAQKAVVAYKFDFDAIDSVDAWATAETLHGSGRLVIAKTQGDDAYQVDPGWWHGVAGDDSFKGAVEQLKEEGGQVVFVGKYADMFDSVPGGVEGKSVVSWEPVPPPSPPAPASHRNPAPNTE